MFSSTASLPPLIHAPKLGGSGTLVRRQLDRQPIAVHRFGVSSSSLCVCQRRSDFAVLHSNYTLFRSAIAKPTCHSLRQCGPSVAEITAPMRIGRKLHYGPPPRSRHQLRQSPPSVPKRMPLLCAMGAVGSSERQQGPPGSSDADLVELRAASAPEAPGVYAVLDDKMGVQYIGLADHAFCIPPEESRWVKFSVYDSGTTREQLQLHWKTWIKEHGAIPPGNKKGETRWSQRAPAPGPQSQAPVPLRAASDHRSSAADALVNKEVLASLELNGFAVIDGILTPESTSEVVAGLGELEKHMQYVDGGSQVQLGREDMVCTLDEAKQGRELLVGTGKSDGRGGEEMAAVAPAGSSAVAAVAQVAALLKGLPLALMEQDAARGEGSMLLPPLAVPHSLMLAVYPGEGARYVAHLDNNTDDPRTSEGPPGQRICDRAVTAITYFNPGWREEDGGCLRIQKLDGSGHVDVAPEAGRLVLFKSELLWHEVLPSFRRRWAMSAWIPHCIDVTTGARTT